MYQKELELAKELAVKAGKVIMKIYETDFDVEIKGDNSPLTTADKNANDVIVKKLKEKFPSYAILSEEIKDDKKRMKNEYCFIVDPLDGTKEFVKRSGEFTVNIALAVNNRVVMGVIYVPVTKELYFAEIETGSYYENLKTKEKIKLAVSDKLEKLVIVGSKSHSSEKERSLIEKNKELIEKSVSAGSSLKGCMVAKGEADVYYRFGLTCEWDTAAMQCVVEQAGGILRQMDNTKMLYNRDNTLNEKGFYIVNREENIWV